MDKKNSKSFDIMKDNFKALAKNFSVKIDFYDDYDNLSEQRVVPLGNYLDKSFPSQEELKITRFLSASLTKR